MATGATIPKSPPNRQPHPHRPQHPQQGLQRHIAIRPQRLVKRLPGDLARRRPREIRLSLSEFNECEQAPPQPLP